MAADRQHDLAIRRIADAVDLADDPVGGLRGQVDLAVTPGLAPGGARDRLPTVKTPRLLRDRGLRDHLAVVDRARRGCADDEGRRDDRSREPQYDEILLPPPPTHALTLKHGPNLIPKSSP